MLFADLGRLTYRDPDGTRVSHRRALMLALDRLFEHLATPTNGLVLFVGIPDDDGEPTIVSFEPPAPLQSSLFLVQGRFVTRVLDEFLE